MKRLVGGLLLAGSVSGQSFADEKPPLEIKAKVWAQYFYDMTEDSIHQNGFDIYRGFLQAGYKFDGNWSALLLLDAQRGETMSVTPGTGDETSVEGKLTKANLWMYLRNAYIQGSDLWGGGGGLRFGLQPTPYFALVDGVTKTRWLGKTLTDQTAILNSQSAGVAFYGSATAMVKYQLIAHNGTEGLSKTGASDSGLAFGALLSLMPFAGAEGPLEKLGVSVYNEVQDATSTAPAKPVTKGTSTLAAALHYESKWADLAVENLTKTEKDVPAAKQTANGVTLNTKFGEMAGLFVRYQTGNELFQASLGGKTLIAAGPSFHLVKDKVMTAIIYETRKAITVSAKDKVGVSWNWAANF